MTKDNHANSFAEYTYDLEGALGEEATQVGIQELRKLMPWILAFNEALAEITVDGETFHKEKENVGAGFSIIKIIGANGNHNDAILINAHTNVSVGVILNDNQLTGIGKDIPRALISHETCSAGGTFSLLKLISDESFILVAFT